MENVFHNHNPMTVKKIAESKYFVAAAFVSGVLLIALVSFGAGVKVGMGKAFFSTHFGQNYERNFLGADRDGGRDGRPGGMMGKMMDRGVRSGHGVAGEILSVSGDTLIIKDRDNQEVTVRLSELTIVNRGPETVASTTLATGESIVVVGKPGDDGVISAQLIRVFPTHLSQ